MRANYDTCLVGSRCVLVPYRPEHVETYHEWMQDPYLLEATGSEPLSLEEELDMQRSWRDDGNKCTFIVLARDGCDGVDVLSAGEDRQERADDALNPNNDFVAKNITAMCGDVNLFLSDEEDGESDVGEDDTDDRRASCDEERPRKQAEINLMIAAENFRGRGVGTEAARMMMLYGARTLGVRRFFVKISEDNTASRRLFERTLGFRECNYVACFREVELEYKYDKAEKIIDKLLTSLSQEVEEYQLPFSRESLRN